MVDVDHAEDYRHMRRAIELAAMVRANTSPNPWVGCVLVTPDGQTYEGATQPPGGPHAEVMALNAAHRAGADLVGSTAYVTLEPCSHYGRTPPCTDALAIAGVGRIVIGIADPDDRVSGRGIAVLRAAGKDVVVGVAADEVASQLAPYLTHRRTGRPYVVLKLAASLDGRTAAPDGTSRWITGHAARVDVHCLRAESDAVLVGAGTVRADDPELTVRHVVGRDPLRVVLGSAPPGAKVQPCIELAGDLGNVLDHLGQLGVLQVLIEGGATVAGDFHRAGLVDRYVIYLAPLLFGGNDARPLLEGPGATTMADVWTGRMVSVTRLGDDLRIDLDPVRKAPTVTPPGHMEPPVELPVPPAAAAPAATDPATALAPLRPFEAPAPALSIGDPPPSPTPPVWPASFATDPTPTPSGAAPATDAAAPTDGPVADEDPERAAPAGPAAEESEPEPEPTTTAAGPPAAAAAAPTSKDNDTAPTTEAD